MKRLAAVVLAIALLFRPSPARADLSGDIKAVLMDKLLSKADVGIEIVKLGDTPKTSVFIFKQDSDIPLIPASNLKVVTTSAALDGLGASFRFRTVLARHGDDLVLIGDGDPTMGDSDLLKKVGWDTTTVFRNWAETLRKRGITRIGNLLVDDSVFEETGVHPAWPADQLDRHYCAEVGGLNLNINCVDFYMSTTSPGNYCAYRSVPSTDYMVVKNTCVSGGDNAIRIARQPGTNNVNIAGSCPQTMGVPVQVAVHDPSLFTATVLAETLKANGIAMGGKVLRDRTARAQLMKLAAPPAAATTSTTVSNTGAAAAATTAGAKEPAAAPPADWQPIAVHETPIAQALARANKDSVNLYAECLCKRLGYAVSGQSGSWENGPAAVGAFLRKAGVDPSEFTLDDGCGLSKKNHISPNALVHVLMYNYFGPNRQTFFNSLSVAGSDGTLEHRFANNSLRGRVFGKSGFVKGVSSLTGYLEARDGNWYAFSILMNGIPELSNSAIKPLQDAIVRAVDANAAK